MAKYSLLLLDAGIVIELFRLGLWERVLRQCEIHLSRVIVNEAKYYEDDDGAQQRIDLSSFTTQVTIHDVDTSQVLSLKEALGRVILDKLDAGEAELLTVLYQSLEPYLICSGDAIAYRVLATLSRSDQGISLEEILQSMGLSRPLEWAYTKAFREHWTHKGFEDKFTGLTTEFPKNQ